MEESDEQLLRQTDEQPAAFGRPYARHERAMLGFVRCTRDPEAAADLCAEMFAAALVSRRRYRPDRDPVVAWLFGIAHHQLAQHHRRGIVEDRAARAAREPGRRAASDRPRAAGGSRP